MIHKCPYTAVYVLIKENKEIHWNAELGNHAIIKAHVCVCEVGTALGGVVFYIVMFVGDKKDRKGEPFFFSTIHANNATYS